MRIQNVICLFITTLVAGCTGTGAGKGQVKQHTLRIVSYNIRHGKGMDGKIDLQRIADIISQKNPDLVALQEVDKNCNRSGNKDIAKELGKILGMEHRFAKFMDFQEGEYGMAILSRLPIRETIRHLLPKGSEPRCALEIRVQTEGFSSPVSFVCIHNDWKNEDVRVKQVEVLLKSLQQDNIPMILAGDFNGTSTDKSMRLLKEAQWRVLEKGGKKTYPSYNPRKEIDFVVIRGFTQTSITHDVVDERIVSDHRPIYAFITFPGSVK